MHSRAPPEPIFRVPTTRYVAFFSAIGERTMGARLLWTERERHRRDSPLSSPSSPGRAQDRMTSREAPQRGSSESPDSLGVSCVTNLCHAELSRAVSLRACLHACLCARAHVCIRVCFTVVPEEFALSPGQALRQRETVSGFKNDRNMKE